MAAADESERRDRAGAGDGATDGEHRRGRNGGSEEGDGAGPPVLVSRPREGVTLLTLNRPDSLNSLDLETIRALRAALDQAAADGSVRVVVLTGSGRAFSAGHDFDELDDLDGEPAVDQVLENQTAFGQAMVAINELPKPVIAAINGAAAGGGLAIALASDTRLCSTSARFNAAFVRLGISGCDVGVSYLLPRIVGATLAFEMMLSGRLIDATEARDAGLVLRVVPDDKLLDAALETAESIIANSPFAIRMTKETMWANLGAPSLRDAVMLEDRTQVLSWQTGDHREAIAALREKRTPRWPAG